MSPTARTLQHLRRLGFTAGVVERWLPRVNHRQDLFGCVDLVAIRCGETGVLAIQCTSWTNLSSRVAKARQRPELVIWLAAGNRFECWGWHKRAGRWVVRRVELRGEDMAAVDLTPRRPRQSRKGTRQGLLPFDGLTEAG